VLVAFVGIFWLADICATMISLRVFGHAPGGPFLVPYYALLLLAAAYGAYEVCVFAKLSNEATAPPDPPSD